MSEPQAKEVLALFLKAREIPVSERQAYVTSQASSAHISREVLQLLQYDVADEFLEQPLIGKPLQHQIEEAVAIDATRPLPGDHQATSELIDGRYKLLQVIGEGGFGVVYMAEQVHPVRRRVALKMLKSSMDTKNIVARFASERQALALMDHPHIAKVLDGGFLPDQRPYFVMELVNGLPITRYCDEHQLDQSARMKLLAQVCLAVHHAHQRGIIHRDLKPTNILVSNLDGQPVPKVIDFGVAKALHGPLVEATLFTSFQQMIGTPEYMSPEQAETSLVDADTRSDVYSLGVLAYELLTGVTPLDGTTLRRMGFGKLQQTIREYEPVRPSERLQTQTQTGPSPLLKRTRPETLRNALRHELDWVVMKAIEKDRNRRYESAQSMADDLLRWINHDPIQARPPSVSYRLKKWVRKHAWQSAVGVAVVLGILVASAGLGYGLSERFAATERNKLLSEKNTSLQRSSDQDRDRAERLLYGDAMLGSHEAFHAGRRNAALDLLKECPSRLRGDEWRWQSYLSSNRAQLIHQGTPQNAQTLLWSLPKHQGLVSAGKDGMVNHWDSTTGTLKRSWRAHDHPVAALAASADGRQLLTASARGELKLWKFDTGDLLDETSLEKSASVLALLDDAHQAVAEVTPPGTSRDTYTVPTFSSTPKAPRIAVGHSDGSIIVFRDGLKGTRLELGDDATRHPGVIQSLEFLPSSPLLISAGKGGIRFWDGNTGQRVRSEGEAWQTYTAILTSTNHAIVYGPPVAAIDLNSSAPPRSYNLPATGIRTAHFVEQQHQLYMATDDQAIRRLNLQSGVHETVGFLQDASVTQLQVADDGAWLAAITDDGCLWLLRASDFSAPQRLDQFHCEVASMAFDSQGKQIWTIGEDGQLIGWTPNSDKAPHVVSAHQSQGFDAVYSKRLQRLITNGLDRSLKVWDPSNHQLVAEYQLALGARYLAIHPDGVHLAAPAPSDLGKVADPSMGDTSRTSGNLALWNLATGKVERVFEGLHNWAMKLAFSHDGTILAAATISDGVVVWDKTPNLPRFFKTDENRLPVSLTFSPDDKFLLVGYRDGQVHVWNVEDGQHVRRMICHGDEVSEILLTPDGSRLITACRSHPSLRIWDWQLGQQVGALDSTVPGVTCLKWADPGRTLAFGGVDGGVRVLRVAP